MEGSLTVRKGAWTKEEDVLLRKCIEIYGEGRWHLAPSRTGLNRCRKSCRLRWLNYLRPNIKRGEFTDDEVDLFVRLHRLLGNRWSLIAARLPGRTANDVKNYWNTLQRKKLVWHKKRVIDTAQKTVITNIVKPRPHTFSKSLPWSKEYIINVDDIEQQDNLSKQSRKVSSPELMIVPNTIQTTIIKPRPHTFSKNLPTFRGKLMIVDNFQSHDNVSMPSPRSTARNGTTWLESQMLVENIAPETIEANMIERQDKSFSKNLPSVRKTTNVLDDLQLREKFSRPSSPPSENDSMWWESLLDDKVGERTWTFHK